MNPEKIDAIVTPDWFRGLKPNHSGYPDGDYTYLAFDTETVDGWPYTLQVTDEQETRLWYLEPKEFLPTLIRWLRPKVESHSRGGIVLWGHVLSFDLPAILYSHAEKFRRGRFAVNCLGVTVEVFYGPNPFAKFSFPNRRVVWVLDSFAFVHTSLKTACSTWGLRFQKLPRPHGLGKRVLRGSDFEAYARRDPEATRELGGRILAMHKDFDIGLTVSVAHMAAKIFAHDFLGGPVEPIPPEVQEAALLAYHGGKNGFYTEPGWKDCTEYDVSSAYPWAMTQLPSAGKGAWHRVQSLHSRYSGFYCVSGTVDSAEPYPILYTHEFQRLSGVFSGVWIDSYSLLSAVRHREVHIREIAGLVWVPRGANRYPLRDFAKRFYELKSTAPDGPMRQMYKVILNSLYGKFVQLTKEELDDGTIFYKPGAYFRPDWGAWITGCVRARMHDLEHRCRALHTATDAIHTQQELPTQEGLGGLEKVITGPCLFVRNKVYFHFASDGSAMKCALHGIRAKPRQVFTMLLNGKRRYPVRHLLKPREAVRLKARPLQEVKRWYSIHKGEIPIHPVPDTATRYWALQRGSGSVASSRQTLLSGMDAGGGGRSARVGDPKTTVSIP